MHITKTAIEKDIPTMFIVAESFPDGIGGAHATLHARIPFTSNRRYFGISHPGPDGHIIYMAAVEVITPGEAAAHKLQTFTIKAGTYAQIEIHNYSADIMQIAAAFDALLQRADLDPNGYCLEWYYTESDVRCMVPLK